MGKQAKLKKIRKFPESDSEIQLQNSADSDPNLFVKHVEKQGYSLKQIKHAPEVPNKRINPQV